jgi:hypothetical protein
MRKSPVHLQRAVENKLDYLRPARMLGRAHYELHEHWKPETSPEGKRWRGRTATSRPSADRRLFALATEAREGEGPSLLTSPACRKPR